MKLYTNIAAMKYILLTALVFLTTLLFACLGIADTHLESSETVSSVVPEDSVLHLVPEKTLGLIYCPSLLELDNRIGTLQTEFSPQTGAPDVPTKVLLNGFESLYRSLTGLEETRIDWSQDFAILLTHLKPLQLSLLAHLTDPEPMRQMIETRTKTGASAKYKDVTYWNDSENSRNFVLLGNTLIISKQREVCENVIDTYIGTRQAVTQNRDYIAFLSDILADTDQLAVYFDVESAIATLDRPLAEELESIMDDFEDDDEFEMLDAVAPFLEGISKNTASIEQVRHVRLRIHIEGTDIQIKPFLKFKTIVNIWRC